MAKPVYDELRRLSNKFLIGDDCWEWIAGMHANGYGKFMRRDQSTALAHRVIYELVKGPVPAGLQLDHLCRNRRCVRPDHLEPVTAGENIRRGQGPCGINARKTHCPRGHAYTEANIYWHHNKRSCRACRPYADALARERKRAVTA